MAYSVKCSCLLPVRRIKKHKVTRWKWKHGCFFMFWNKEFFWISKLHFFACQWPEMVLQTVIQIMPHILVYVMFLYCCPFLLPMSLSLLLPFPVWRWRSAILHTSCQQAPFSKAWVDQCQMDEQFTSPLPPICIRWHLAKLKFIGHLAIYQKVQGRTICPFVSNLCKYKDTIYHYQWSIQSR